MKKQEIIQRTIFQIGFGIFLLFVWFAIEKPKNIVNNRPPNSIDDPGLQLFINFVSWLTLAVGIGFLLVGIAGLIRLLVRK